MNNTTITQTHHTGVFTITLYRDPQTKQHLSIPRVFKKETYEEAQAYAQRLLKAGLKHHDFGITREA